jgi:replicative DNA helicase
MRETFDHQTQDQSTKILLMTLPHSNEAESSLISCFLQDPTNRIGDARNTLNVSAFHSDAHKRIFTALVALYDKGAPIDPPLITQHFRNRGELEAVGGAAYISELFCFIPNPAHYLEYKRVVQDKYLARRNIEAHQAALEAFQNESLPIADAIEKAQAALDAVENAVVRKLSRITIREAIGQTMNEIEERMKRGGALPGWTTGFPMIDAKCGGLQKGRVTVFAGLPSDGKSAIMQNCARNALVSGAKVAWYSLEMPNTEQTLRLLCEDSGVDNGALYSGLMSRGQQDMLRRSIQSLSDMGCDLVNTDTASASEILADIEHGGYDIAVVDYLQLMEDEGRKGATREEIIARISRRMKQVAKRTGTHILTASQLNDSGKLRESRAIGQDADGVFMISKVEKENGEGTDDTLRNLWCDKNRGGSRHWTLPLAFNGPTFTFKEIAE